MIEPLYDEIISSEYINENNLILMGDSAGGGMALGLVEKLNEENIMLPSKTILISPWLDVTMENPDISTVQKLDKQLNKEALRLAGASYAGENGIDSYLVNPIIGNLSELTNISIITGTNDILNPDVWLLDKKAKEVETELEIIEFEDAGHIWMIENYGDDDIIKDGYNKIIELIQR